ncbi:MAG TPA: molybdopterin molybdotransferase MoeA, partial [Synergistales bacterium]|nr:molybdopterin molybdotransferase MoeA [Synergistales bacterium]
MVKNWKEHIDLTDVWTILRERFSRLEDRVILMGSTDPRLSGKILAQDVIALRNIPHFNASAVDGYAIKASSTSGSTPATPCVLPEDSFQWVNTGAEIPDIFDCVLMIEDSSLSDSGELLVYQTLSSGDNVRPVGEDVFKGQVIGRRGDRINPAMTALLPSAGVKNVHVLGDLRVIFIPTGDEIVPAEKWLETVISPEGRVMESNSLMLKAFFSQWELSLDTSPVLPDNPEVIRKQLLEAVSSYDLVLIGAGSAKGKKDHIARIIAEEGELLFHWILMKPGRPVMAGLVRDVPVVDMPGFPMSTAVVCWSVVYPLIRLL